jgi:hypothetical protein
VYLLKVIDPGLSVLVQSSKRGDSAKMRRQELMHGLEEPSWSAILPLHQFPLFRPANNKEFL